MKNNNNNKMTKLMEWLAALIAFLAFYLYLYKFVVTGESNLSETVQLHITLLPIHLVVLFGVSLTHSWCIFCFVFLEKKILSIGICKLEILITLINNIEMVFKMIHFAAIFGVYSTLSCFYI